MKYRKFFVSAACVTTALTLLAGCAAQTDGKSGKKYNTTDNGDSEAYAEDYYEPCETTAAYDYAEGDTGYESAGLSATYKSGDYDYYEYDAVECEADYSYDYEYDDYSGTTDSNGKVLDPEAERLLVRTVSIDVKTTTYDTLCNSVNSKIDQYGGYIEYLSAYGTGEEDDMRYAYYTIRVPAENLDALVEALDGNCTIVSQSESTTDVTLDYVDTQSYLEALEIEYDQILEMLDEAKDLDTIIILQDELADLRYEIEYAESSLRVMENQVTYATLNLSITEITPEKAQEEEEERIEEKEKETKPEPTFEEEIAETFNESLENAKEFFKEVFLGLVSVAIIVVPVTVIVIIAVIIICVKLHKRKKAKKLAAKKGEEKKEENKDEIKKEKE